jgi:hypothetical protein
MDLACARRAARTLTPRCSSADPSLTFGTCLRRGLRVRRRRRRATITWPRGQRGGELDRAAVVRFRGSITPRVYSGRAAHDGSRGAWCVRVCGDLRRRFSNAHRRLVPDVETGVLRAQPAAVRDDLFSIDLGRNLLDGTIQVIRRTNLGRHLHCRAPREPDKEQLHRHLHHRLHHGAFSNERATRDSWARKQHETEIRPVLPRRCRRRLGLEGGCYAEGGATQWSAHHGAARVMGGRSDELQARQQLRLFRAELVFGQDALLL